MSLFLDPLRDDDEIRRLDDEQGHNPLDDLFDRVVEQDEPGYGSDHLMRAAARRSQKHVPHRRAA